MKSIRPFILPVVAALAASAAVSTAQAQSTATTSPVGYTTVEIQGSSTGNPVYSLVQFPMMNASSFQGTTTSVAGSALTFDGTPFTSGAFDEASGVANYIAIVNSAEGEGTVYDIVSNTASAITVVGDVAQTSPLSISVVKTETAADIFGTGTDYVLQGGGNPASADVFYVGRGTALEGFYYKTGFGSGYKTLSGAAVSSLNIYPGESVLIERKAAGDVSIVDVGSVKTETTLVPVGTGYVSGATGFPVATTLDDSNLLASGLQGGGNAASADRVFLTSAAGVIDAYFYKTGFGSGWKAVAGGASAGDTVIGETTGVLILSKSSTPFNWSVAVPYVQN